MPDKAAEKKISGRKKKNFLELSLGSASVSKFSKAINSQIRLITFFLFKCGLREGLVDSLYDNKVKMLVLIPIRMNLLRYRIIFFYINTFVEIQSKNYLQLLFNNKIRFKFQIQAIRSAVKRNAEEGHKKHTFF